MKESTLDMLEDIGKAFLLLLCNFGLVAVVIVGWLCVTSKTLIMDAYLMQAIFFVICGFAFFYSMFYVVTQPTDRQRRKLKRKLEVKSD